MKRVIKSCHKNPKLRMRQLLHLSKGFGKSNTRFSKTTLAIFMLSFAAVGSYIITHSFAATPTTYYVSKNGSDSGGTSWATAWNELNQINWSVINPGDTITIDGGSTICASNY